MIIQGQEDCSGYQENNSDDADNEFKNCDKHKPDSPEQVFKGIPCSFRPW